MLNKSGDIILKTCLHYFFSVWLYHKGLNAIQHLSNINIFVQKSNGDWLGWRTPNLLP